MFDTLSPALKAAYLRYEEECIEWRNSQRENPRREYLESLEAIVACAADRNNVEQHQHEAASQLIGQYVSFLTQRETSTQLPSQDVMRALDALRIAQPVAATVTEPIEELIKLPGITHEQIAKMHGIPILDVGAILAGRKEYPKNHQTPMERERNEKVLKDARLYRDAVLVWRNRPKDTEQQLAEAAGEVIPPSESVEELLLLPGMTLQQVAKMTNKSIREIEAIRDGRPYVPQERVNPLDELDEEEQNNGNSENPPNAEYLKQQEEREMLKREVYAIADGNPEWKPKQIAEVVGCSPQQVGLLLKERKEQEQEVS